MPISTLPLSDTERVGKLTTPLSDKLVLRTFSGVDAMDDPFEYHIEALSTDPQIDADKLLGDKVTVAIQGYDGKDRYFNGLCTELSWLGTEDNAYVYGLTLRPWFYLLTLARFNQIYHQKSVIDILKEVFGRHSYAKFQDKTSASYDKLHYTVQWDETDFNFASRMMERFGISYYFEHKNGEHTMVLCDGAKSHGEIGGRAYLPVDIATPQAEERFWHLGTAKRVNTGKVKLKDYNHQSSKAKMEGEAAGTAKYKTAKIEDYTYPGGYEQSGQATKVAKLRLEQHQTDHERLAAQGDVLALNSGLVVAVMGEHDGGLDGDEYICVTAHHSFVNNGFSTDGFYEDAAYSADYGLHPKKVPLRPKLKTPLSRIEGPQTAKVVASKNAPTQEIECDELGRVFVKFHWDLEARCSMRVRCAQMWAHNKWGSMFIPRVGMEVVVIFVNGDPDQPLIVGCVYNDANKPPFDLPADKNINGIKSNSTLGGGGFNQLSFDDTKGKELFYQHAQYDMETKVLNDERREVDVNRTTTIGKDETRTVKENEIHTILKNSTWTVKENQTYTVDKNSTWTIKQNQIYTINQNSTWTVKQNRNTEVKMNDTHKVGMVWKNEAKAKIEFKCGQSKITMTPASIEIKSIKIDVKATAMLTTQGLKVDHKATAIMTIKGAMVMIN